MTPDDLPPNAAEAYRSLVEEPGAPIWTHPREDRLTAPMRAEVRAYAAQVRTQPPAWPPGGEPAWLDAWLDEVWARVPFHAGRGPRPGDMVDIAPPDREDVRRSPEAFVPHDIPVEELLAYQTSGTAGPPATVPGHPVSTASYYPLLLHAASAAVAVRPRPDQLDWVTLISQDVGGYIIPSWSSVLGCLTAQVNLRPHGWTDPADARTFLERHDPRCLTGDPVAFADLLDLQARLHPQLLVCTASMLSDGLRAALEDRFDAPVLDVYSTTESGPIAARLDGGPLRLVQPRLFVEATLADGRRCAPGEIGQITLTGGLNRAMPLVRHRTGDMAALSWPPGAAAPVLTDFEARRPVLFVAGDGRAVNSHSVTVALRPVALPRFTLHQDGQGDLVLGVDQPGSPSAVEAARLVRELLDQPLSVAGIGVDTDKVLAYRSPFSSQLVDPL